VSEMSTRKRFAVFGVGFAIGCVILVLLMQGRANRRAEKPERPDNIPGVVMAYLSAGEPIPETYAVDEWLVEGAAPGQRQRWLSMGGSRPDTWILILENQRPGLTGGYQVVDWTIFDGDRLWLDVKPNTDTARLSEALRSYEVRLLQRLSVPANRDVETLLASMPPKGIEAGMDAMNSIGQMETVVTVRRPVLYSIDQYLAER
jgi:hypothetical protein